MYKPKPKPRTSDDICVKHNRKLKDYEIFGGGCQLCALEAKSNTEHSTIIHVLPPVSFKCEFFNLKCERQCTGCKINQFNSDNKHRL